ncbi:O-antigen ligase family protein [Flavobacterium soli]|uniref:O-antigen ligase family protein n=1 Tax=Flavobacterium soli TaxID=344881 RepID=UPI0003FB7BF6|nr:O-antigen ligase family protein [Flavobacterium soli]
MSGLQKEVLFFLIPLAFLLVPNLAKIDTQKIFRYYSFGMVLYALFYFGNAIVRFIQTGNKAVFFYHELVTLDLNAIYVAVFASFAMFYFISRKGKTLLEQISIFILAVFIFLLSSKSIIFIDFLLIIYFYIYFAETQNSVKLLTIASVTAFLVFSLVFVKEIRERFLIEYETAFVDNTLNEDIGNGNVYNVSLNQAWNNEKFEQNHFFPGTAMRIYQTRIFGEMLQEQNIFFTGLGLEASQENIRKKTEEHNLYPGYGDFNFHNQYVQTFAELGIFGFLILVAMLVFNIKNAIADKNFLHIVFSLTMIILFLTESFFCRQRGIVFFVVLYSIFNAVRMQKKVLKPSL